MRSVAEAEAEVARILDDLNSAGEGVFQYLQQPSSKDFEAVGAIVQGFAYADLNGRRALEIIAHINGQQPRAVNTAYRDGEVLPTLLARLDRIPLDSDEQKQCRTALSMLISFSSTRHLLAHWAVRRHRDHDALVALTMNEREAFRRAKHEPEPFKGSIAVIPMPEVRANVPVMAGNVDYLASRVSEWWVKFITAKT